MKSKEKTLPKLEAILLALKEMESVGLKKGVNIYDLAANYLTSKKIKAKHIESLKDITLEELISKIIDEQDKH